MDPLALRASLVGDGARVMEIATEMGLTGAR